MFTVKNFCCCFSLKYGIYTMALIGLIARFSSAVGLYFLAMGYQFDVYYRNSGESNAAIGNACGWFIVTSFVVFVALIGIVQKRHMLIYPYIVILILELIIANIACIMLSIFVTPFHLITVAAVTGLSGYYIICVISLYSEIRALKENRKHEATEGIPYIKV